MAPAVITDHRLVMHIFAPLTQGRGEIAWSTLGRVWAAYEHHLGLTQAIPAIGAPTDPIDPPGITIGIVAARQDPHHSGTQAMWAREHDTASVSICLTEVGEDGWTTSHSRWHQAVDGIDLDAMLGTVTVFAALTAKPPSPTDGPLHTTIEAQLPGHAHPGWASSAVTCHNGIVIWRTTTDNPTACYVALAGKTDNDHLGDLVWTSNGGPAPLTRYLLQAAKLRDQARIRHRDAEHIHRLRLLATSTLDSLATILLPRADQPSGDELQHGWAELANLQAAQAGLTNTIANVRSMRRTVAIATANMTAWRSRLGARTDQPGWLGHDASLAQYLDAQLGDDESYLDTAHQRAHQLGAIIEQELTRRSAAAEHHAHQRQEHLVLLSSALITALLTCLTAIQAIGYHLPLPGPLQSPTIVLSTAAVFFAATVALRGAGTIRYLAIALLSAATTWCAIAEIWLTRYHSPAPATLTWLSALVLAVLSVAAMVLTRRLRSIRHLSAAPRRN